VSLKLDYFHLLDVRVPSHAWGGVKNQLLNALSPSNMKWDFFYVEGGVGGASGRQCTVGGQIVAYTNRLTQVKCENIIKLGGAVGLQFNVGSTQFVSVSTYWPCRNDSPGSFQSLIGNEYGGLDATTLLKQGIDIAVSSALEAGKMVLVGGDFNSDLARNSGGLAKWAHGLGLSNASSGAAALRPSFRTNDGKHQSRIDHVFSSDGGAVLECSPFDPEFLVSQHLPVLIRLKVAYCVAKGLFQGRKRVSSLHCPISRANRIAQLCSEMESSSLADWDDPDSILQFIGIRTVQVCTLAKGRRREKNGWSPITKGLTMNLRAIITMLRHVNGYKAHKNLRWSAENYLPGLNLILRKWRQHGRKISFTGEAADA